MIAAAVAESCPESHPELLETKNHGRDGTHAHSGVWQPTGCVSCEPVCVCVSLVCVVIICPASTHTALVSSPSLAVLHLPIPTYLGLGLCSPQPGTNRLANWVRFLAPRSWACG